MVCLYVFVCGVFLMVVFILRYFFYMLIFFLYGSMANPLDDLVSDMVEDVKQGVFLGPVSDEYCKSTMSDCDELIREYLKDGFTLDQCWVNEKEINSIENGSIKNITNFFSEAYRLYGRIRCLKEEGGVIQTEKENDEIKEIGIDILKKLIRRIKKLYIQCLTRKMSK